MTGPGLLWSTLGGVLVLAVLAIPLARVLGRNSGYVLAAAFTAAATLFATLIPAVSRGEVLASGVDWIPALGIRLSLRLDALSMLFVLLVLVVGALVLAYSARYLIADGDHRRFYALLVAFAGAMLGLVLAGDLVMLFVFWELTSVLSYFLIGGKGRGGARPALRAFIVTGAGGLCLLAAVILIGSATGSYDVGAMLADPDLLAASSLAPVIIGLLIAAAFTKSAQFPFHFWLPGAMVAPTPVSTYLHAATMVKAGIYLLMRMGAVFGSTTGWIIVLTCVGAFTSVYGSILALKQHDLKAILAYSTVSQLGLMVALAGVGTYEALVALTLLIIAHACYKGTLFMVVGIIDREAGSRDIRELSGLRRAMPLVATITGLAGLSMAGVPPLLGFSSKESAFDALVHAGGPGWLAPLISVAILAGTVTTFAYGIRIFWGAFEGPLTQKLYEPARSFSAAPGITALAGLVLGVTLAWMSAFVGRVAADATGIAETIHLSIWHGFNLPLLMSAVTIVGGIALSVVVRRPRADRWMQSAHLPGSGPEAFDAIYTGVLRLGAAVGRPFVAWVPMRHLTIVLVGLIGLGVLAWASLDGPAVGGTPPPSRTIDWFLAALIGAGALGAALARDRVGAIATLGVTGFLIATLWLVLGQPDLALTQLLVETLTVLLVVLVFRRQPNRFASVRASRRVAAAVIAVAAGVLAMSASYALSGRRAISEAGAAYVEAGPTRAGGTNLVNTILVDFRAMDTFGEISVLAATAAGVWAVVRVVRVKR